MKDATTRYGIVKFRSPRARPRIIGVYAGAGGWSAPGAPLRLTRETAQTLRAQGFTMVRVKWRWHTHEIILRRYLGE